MSVVPAGTVRLCPKSIRERATWRDRALRDRGHPIKPGSQLLRLPMRMDRESFLRRFDVVCDRYSYCVAPIGLYERTGELVVDEYDALVVAIGGVEASRNDEVVRPYYTSIRRIAG